MIKGWHPLLPEPLKETLLCSFSFHAFTHSGRHIGAACFFFIELAVSPCQWPAGGRDLTWPSELIAAHLLRASSGRIVQALLHGSARGADQAIATAANQLGWPQIACPAAWQQHGRAAGPIRNRQMLERSLDLAAALPLGAGLLVIAFPGSRGTASLVDQARRLSRRSAIPIEVIEIAA